ncbi:MAG: hypothetical protein U0269_16310 [Polyangiales bacterium]
MNSLKCRALVACALASLFASSRAFAQSAPSPDAGVAPGASPSSTLASPPAHTINSPEQNQPQPPSPPQAIPTPQPLDHPPSTTAAPAHAAPAAPEAPAAQSPIPLRAYGFIRAMIDLSNGVETFTNPNASAITAAVNPVFLQAPDDPYLSFQIQQSRVGLMINERGPVRGQIELDFIHFDQSTPTTAAFPRVRIAEVQLALDAKHRFFLGQNWDIFSPTNPFSANPVGNLFQAGNAGFMRHQLGWVGTFGLVELAAALGFQGANNGPTYNFLEMDAVPTGSLRAAIRTQTHGWFGLSAIATAPRYASGAMTERRLSLGLDAFADLKFGPLELRAAGYFGQNLANIGALTLSQGRFGQDVDEIGGYLSAKISAGVHAFTATVGAAAVLTNNVAIGYAPASTNAMGVSTAAVRNAALGPGIVSNLGARASYAANVWRGLSLVIEPFVYRTEHALAPDDQRLGSVRLAMGLETGAVYNF